MGLLSNPQEEQIAGDPDCSAETADGEVLAVSKLIGLGLADVQIFADVADGEVTAVSFVFHAEVPFINVFSKKRYAGRTCIAQNKTEEQHTIEL